MMTAELLLPSQEPAKNVGILGMEIYFPSMFVEQEEMEAFDGVSSGKYTIGLGQDRMAVCLEDEDVYSMALTVVSRLLKAYQIDPNQIGRLEVGTESNLDRAKSVKSYLMQLFPENESLSGVDCINACFGGTAALMNSVAWMESREWDGRLAIVVAADIAVYAKGPARPTGGAGAVAILIGPGASLVFERGLSATHMAHTFDFYKPDPFSPYPIVDGKHSILSYTTALKACCERLQAKIKSATQQHIPILSLYDHLVFHSPYTKLVRKAFNQIAENEAPLLSTDPELLFTRITEPSTRLSKELGNLYCASVYVNLIALICNVDDLLGKRIGVFSYGSGLASMLFSIRVEGSVKSIRDNLALEKRLSARVKLSPIEYEAAMERREQVYGRADWTPQLQSHTSHLCPDVYSLASVDASFRRYYTGQM